MSNEDSICSNNSEEVNVYHGDSNNDDMTNEDQEGMLENSLKNWELCLVNRCTGMQQPIYLFMENKCCTKISTNHNQPTLQSCNLREI